MKGIFRALRLRPALTLGMLVALVSVTTASASNPGQYTIDFSSSDQKAARTLVPRRSDLGPGHWAGGTVKPDLTPGASCPNYHPKRSDLVLTGAAASDWKKGPLEFEGDSRMFKTPQMLRLGYQRAVEPVGAVPCLRHQLETRLPPGWRVVSFERMAIPHVAPYVWGVRGLMTYSLHGRRLRLLGETLALGKGRTGIDLSAYGEDGVTQHSLTAAALRLAHILAARMPA